MRVPFASFEVSLSDDTAYGVRQNDPSAEPKKEINCTFYLKDAHGKTHDWAPKLDANTIIKFATRIESETPWLIRYGPDQFVDRRTDEVLTALEVVSAYPEYAPESALRRRAAYDTPEWIQTLKKRVGVHLVEAQRLFRFPAPAAWDARHYPAQIRPSYVETVKDCAKDLQRRISETLAEYAKVSQALDQSFPERLLKGRLWEGLPIGALKERMSELETERGRLTHIGLIEQGAAYPFDISSLEKADDSQRSVMTVYVQDTQKKLGVLGDLARRIDLLTENINRKFQHKAIRVSKDNGLEALSTDGKKLELAGLSSGEQHEIVLLYDLLFRVKSNTLVLIDEPELSLHVTWQKAFLPDLLKIVAETKFDVVLATHSPFIVGERDDLTTALLADE